MLKTGESGKVYMIVKMNIGNDKSHRVFYTEVGDVQSINDLKISRSAGMLKNFANNFNKGSNAMHKPNKVYFEAKCLDSYQMAQEIFDCKFNDGYDMARVTGLDSYLSSEQEFNKFMTSTISKFVRMSSFEVSQLIEIGERANRGLEM